MKRVLLFLATNLAVVLVLGIVANLLGVNRFLTANGLNLGALLGFAAIMGFGGAFISLLMSKPIAKWSTGAHVIDQPRNATEQWLVDSVARMAKGAGIPMPEVAIYEGEPNALPPAQARAAPWSRSPPACCRPCRGKRPRPSSPTKSLTSPTATW